MKTGILTFHRALNYGALLQAFALRYAIDKIGGHAEIVDYRNELMENIYRYPSFFECRNLKEKIKYIVYGKHEKKRRANFEEYRKKYLNLSDSVYTKENISSADKVYERFITGSDQVWNYDAHGFDKNFFLDFVKEKEKKYSYAASFGISSLPKGYIDDYRCLLENFSICSVREKQGLNIIEGLGIDIGRIDIDPTMLLTKEEWISAFDIKKTDKKYIFVYAFELSDGFKNFVEELSNKTGYTVLCPSNTLRKFYKCRCEFLKEAGPAEFITALANAEYVVTNSFHGTALSINLNKNFYVDFLKKGAKVNSRIENILDLFSLQDRVIDSKEINNKIDFDVVNSKLGELRQRSFDYLGEITK